MSLILDALRKADSERGRGSVPGLHAQPLAPPAQESDGRPRVQPWHWILVGLAVGLVVALAGYLGGRQAPRQPGEAGATSTATAKAVSATPPAPAPPATLPATATPAPPAPPAPAASGAADASNAPAPATSASPRPQAVAEPAAWPQQESPKAPPKAPAAAPSQAQADAKAAAPAAAPPGEPPIYAREQLPQHIRAELPALAIGGSIYSPRAADRTLIVNGRLFRENDALTADLTLEQIRQNSAVLRYKGYRYELPF